MSPRNVEARLIADEATTGDVRAVEVFGHVLTTSFAKIEVEDDVLAKLQGNPHIEVRERGERAPFDAEAAKARLTELGVEIPAKASNKVLAELLERAETARAAADAEAEQQ